MYRRTLLKALPVALARPAALIAQRMTWREFMALAARGENVTIPAGTYAVPGSVAFVRG